ncbi:MAG: serine protease [Candidatus Paceibacterota bacterium]|jgi:hypothetical protein
MKNLKDIFLTKYFYLYTLLLVLLALISYAVFSQIKNTSILKEYSSQQREYEEKRLADIKEVNSLKEQIQNLQQNNKKIESRPISTVYTKSEENLPKIIETWTPRIAKITCDFIPWPGSKLYNRLESAGIDPSPQTAQGSGFLVTIYDTTSKKYITEVVTNHHVITGHNGFSSANLCQVELGKYKYQIFKDEDFLKFSSPNSDEVITIQGTPYVVDSLDAAALVIKNPDPEIFKISKENFACEETPKTGEKIVILGFPGIGSSNSVTATEGIISGNDNGDYVTSAKVEHGNSGGAAIWLKNNCYIGIPTYAISGEIESLARILDAKNFFGSK